MNGYKLLCEGSDGVEIVEKKSRFIAHVIPVETEEEALIEIEKIKKQYWDARHNCYAFVIGINNEIQRFSDDGEPQGTAGKPILEVLLNMEVHNALVVITRYFGGTLLGTGGLIRAYSRSAKEGLLNSVIMTNVSGVEVVIEADYNDFGKIQYLFSNEEIMFEAEYMENVIITAKIEDERAERILKKVNDVTAAKAVIKSRKDIYFLC